MSTKQPARSKQDAGFDRSAYLTYSSAVWMQVVSSSEM
jgi:hypothetical protein